MEVAKLRRDRIAFCDKNRRRNSLSNSSNRANPGVKVTRISRGLHSRETSAPKDFAGLLRRSRTRDLLLSARDILHSSHCFHIFVFTYHSQTFRFCFKARVFFFFLTRSHFTKPIALDLPRVRCVL